MNASVEKALQTLGTGDAAAAMEVVLDALKWPASVEPDDFKALIEAMGKIGGKFRKLPFAKELKEAARKPDDGKMLFELGQALLEEELFGPAATILHRAYSKRRQHEETLAELVYALESLGDNAAALHALRTADEELVEDSFVLQYLLAFNALMCREVDTARTILPDLLDENDAELKELSANLAEMLARVDAVKGVTSLDANDLRGWHFVTTGSVLLHRAQGETGRFETLADSPELVSTGIALLKDALAAAGLAPAQVMAPDDARSVLLGKAVSSSLGVPFKVLPPNGSLEHGLIAVYDLALLDEKLADTLQWNREGQALFAHLSTWAEEPPFAPDFTTALYRTVVPLAGDMAAAKVSTEKDSEAVRKIVAAASKMTGSAAPGWLQKQGQRRRQRTDSPVPRR